MTAVPGPTTMRRILVIGSGGAGKSTLAQRLGERLGLPVIHLDASYWRPGWIETPKDEWADQVSRLVAGPAWVMDGNYSGTIDLRIAAADTIIFLDLPRLVCPWRVVKRRVRFHGRARPDVSPGCPERITGEFIDWIWSYPGEHRPRMLERLRLAAAAGKRVVVLGSHGEVERFLGGIVAPDTGLHHRNT